LNRVLASIEKKNKNTREYGKGDLKFEKKIKKIKINESEATKRKKEKKKENQNENKRNDARSLALAKHR
jgi:hypothetical protein